MNRLLCCECINCSKYCTNNKFQNRIYKNVVKKKISNVVGYGLYTKEKINKNEFIIEYIGEVIDNEELEKRTEDNINDGRFYFLTLSSTRHIDALNKGNLSRYANHSCDPNVDFKVQLNSDNDSPISLSFHSLKKIKKDDQLFTSYLPSPKMKYDQRQKYLLDNWGFVCQCKKCITESQKKNLN